MSFFNADIQSSEMKITKDTDAEFIALELVNESDASSTDGSVGIRFDLEDTSGNVVDSGKILVSKEQIFTSTGTTQDSKMSFYTSLDGTLDKRMSLTEKGQLIIFQSGQDINTGIKMMSGTDIQTYWNIYVDNTTGGDLAFYPNGDTDLGGWIRDQTDIGPITGTINFTGQHRNIMNNNITTSAVGLIVSSTGKYINLDNNIISNINESLPICEITSENNDKKVFGVLSDKEDSETTRKIQYGVFGSVYKKQNTNEQRIYINSLGEGALWVCNKNGTIENGDYISSSTVPGYGVKQADDLLHNYTVAKLTCDCNFSTTKIVKQKLKVSSTTLNGVTTTAIDYDSNGDIQYENDLDLSGNQQMVYEHDTRFLEADGTQIPESEYTTKLANSESVYIACFVGCTYHCG